MSGAGFEPTTHGSLSISLRKIAVCVFLSIENGRAATHPIEFSPPFKN